MLGGNLETSVFAQEDVFGTDVSSLFPTAVKLLRDVSQSVKQVPELRLSEFSGLKGSSPLLNLVAQQERMVFVFKLNEAKITVAVPLLPHIPAFL